MDCWVIIGNTEMAPWEVLSEAFFVECSVKLQSDVHEKRWTDIQYTDALGVQDKPDPIMVLLWVENTNSECKWQIAVG